LATRFAQRTGENSLLSVLSSDNSLNHLVRDRQQWRLYLNLRDLLWWDGEAPPVAPLEDAVLATAGVARFAAVTPKGTDIVLALKAGHNAEHHNQNDVGSFMVNAGGENLLVDPGRGLYNRAYFSARRYENIFANSYGHSVPRIGGALQGAGADYRGTLLETSTKRAKIEFAKAYPVAALQSATREFVLEDNGTLHLHDTFSFTESQEVEEAFVTWGEVEVNGNTAIVRGHSQALRLTIEEPNTVFALEVLEVDSLANRKPQILKRLTFSLSAQPQNAAKVRIEVVE
jgi:hypothetical protein